MIPRVLHDSATTNMDVMKKIKKKKGEEVKTLYGGGEAGFEVRNELGSWILGGEMLEDG